MSDDDKYVIERELSNEIEALAKKHGGWNGQHPDYTLSEWIDDVVGHDTRLGYWEWVYHNVAMNGETPDDFEALE